MSRSAVAPAPRAALGALSGAAAFCVVGIAEINSRLHQGGVAQLVGPPRPSWGADASQIVTLIGVAAIAGIVAALVPRLDRVAATAFASVLLAVSILGWIAFTEPTFVSFGESMELTVPRIIHAGSTSVGTFVLLGIVLGREVRVLLHLIAVERVQSRAG